MAENCKTINIEICGECGYLGKPFSERTIAKKAMLLYHCIREETREANRTPVLINQPACKHGIPMTNVTKQGLMEQYKITTQKTYICPGPDKLSNSKCNYSGITICYDKCKDLPCGCKSWDKIVLEIENLTEEINALS